MSSKCFVIVFQESSREALAKLHVKAPIIDAASFQKSFDQYKIPSLIIMPPQNEMELCCFLESYVLHYGPLPDFVSILDNDPSPKLQTAVYEFGVDSFWLLNDIDRRIDMLSQQVAHIEADSKSAEHLIAAAHFALRHYGQSQIEEALRNLVPFAQYNYQAAYSCGKLYEALGDFQAAIKAYHRCLNLNNLFRPATMSEAECLLIVGQSEDALKLLLNLELVNDHCLARKTLLAATYSDQKNLPKAEEYVTQAQRMSTQSAKSIEAKAHFLIAKEQIDDAMQLVSSLNEVGPFFTAKLNEVGIALSQSGKGRQALALYEKAHDIVRPELRFKISLNAALAAHRVGEAKLALSFLDRCQQEFGGSFSKLEKIRAVVLGGGKAEGAA